VGDAVRELAVWQKEQKVYRYTKFSKIMKTNINIVVVFQYVNIVVNKLLFVYCQYSLVSHFKSFPKYVAENDDLLVTSLKIYEKYSRGNIRMGPGPTFF
jgi:hypothetical protein